MLKNEKKQKKTDSFDINSSPAAKMPFINIPHTIKNKSYSKAFKCST